VTHRLSPDPALTTSVELRSHSILFVWSTSTWAISSGSACTTVIALISYVSFRLSPVISLSRLLTKGLGWVEKRDTTNFNRMAKITPAKDLLMVKKFAATNEKRFNFLRPKKRKNRPMTPTSQYCEELEVALS
jgi:hypothetical protein